MPTLGDKPNDPRFSDLMVAAMGGLDEAFNGTAKAPNKKIGLVLLVFEYGEAEGPCNYISNGADRRDIAVMLREQAARFEGQPEIKGHA